MKTKKRDIDELIPNFARVNARATDIFCLLNREYGPVTWIQRYDPISELVFTILSQHTSDVNAERAFDNLVARFKTWDSIIDVDLDSIIDCVRVGGLARIKAPRIQRVLRRIIDLQGNLDLSFLTEMPMKEAKSWLRALPGVGPKTAAIVLSFSFGLPAMPVDTHIFRVTRRLGLLGPKINAEQAHDILESIIDPVRIFASHVYLINHGRRICKAVRPLCDQCVLSLKCPSSRL